MRCAAEVTPTREPLDVHLSEDPRGQLEHRSCLNMYSVTTAGSYSQKTGRQAPETGKEGGG